MFPQQPSPLQQTRRAFLGRTALGMGAVALASLWPRGLKATGTNGAQGQYLGLTGFPHFAPKAKRVIFLYMAGGPSHLELFDNKPTLTRLDGQPMPTSITQGQPIAQLQGEAVLRCLGPRFPFRRYGDSGAEMSTLFPHMGSLADDICIIRSMHTDQINHDPANTLMNTGTAISGRPSMGAWITYGLGTESNNLPGFIVMSSEGGRSPQPISQRMWGAGFLPGRFQGVPFHSTGSPVLYLDSPPGVSRQQQGQLVDAIGQLDQLHNQAVDNPDIQTRLAQYELAFRMQTSIPELMDFSDEPAHIKDLYGTQGADGSFAANCLLARRLAERGVRFIQLYHRGWDHHDNLVQYMNISSGLVDRATAALVNDLKQRGMLDDTLVIWGGEFGRTPMVQIKGGGVGRDHHMRGYSMWLAGGGIKPGMSYGATDEFGYFATENPVHVRDLHATMLHCLGIDHEEFSVRFQGLDFRLSGVEPARVVEEILA